MNESYFERETREAKTADRDAFIEQHKQTLVEQWPELWTEKDEQRKGSVRCTHDR